MSFTQGGFQWSCFVFPVLATASEVSIDAFVGPDRSYVREVRGLQERDACASQLLRGDTKPQRSKKHQRYQILPVSLSVLPEV